MKKLAFLLCSIGFCYTLSANAADLKTAFMAAQRSDPTYQGAEATYKAAQATIGQAHSKLLPNLTLTGSWMHADTDINTETNYSNTPGDVKSPTNTLIYTLALTQPLFNWQAIAGYDQIKATVKQAAATYAFYTQDLINRTASAYFAVLQAQEVLRYTEAQKAALNRQLQVAKQRYEVGLDPITSVYDAQSQYDSTVALYIANENSLANQKETLRQITGQLYPNLARLKDEVPLLQPEPANIDEWTKRAEQQNANLQAQRFAVLAAEKNIKVQSAQNLPELNLAGTYNSSRVTQTNFSASQTVSGLAYGVNLTLPIYSGGNINAQTEQAQYQYQAAVALLEFTHRQTLANTRTAYLSVIAEISQIQADQQAIKSAAAALASNEAGYKVGTQTIADVLTAQSNLYRAQTQYATDRYAYVTNTIALKEAAGTLNANDVEQINAWLTDAPFTAAKATQKVAAIAPKKPIDAKKVAKRIRPEHDKSNAPHHAVKKPATHKTPVHKAPAHKPAVKHPAQPAKKPVVKKAAPAVTTSESNTDWNQ
jgi:outer membrane protein